MAIDKPERRHAATDKPTTSPNPVARNNDPYRRLAAND